jgi:hypothetical protein
LQFGKSESWQTGKMNLGQCKLHNLAKVKLANRKSELGKIGKKQCGLQDLTI